MTDLSFGQRLLLYLYSNGHIVGSLAALVGLGLFLAGVIDKGWWAIVAGLYVAGVLLVPKDETAERIARAQFDEDHLRDQLDNLIRMARNKVPVEAGRRLESIRDHAQVLLPKLKDLTERGTLSAAVRHDVIQMLTRYLPDTLSSFLRLPTAYTRLHTDSRGKSPQDLLIGQLKLLEENLGRAVQDAFSEDIAQLEVQGRFLSEKFQGEPET